MTQRCLWSRGDPLNEHYHDEEWGVPCYDDKKLFEFLVLESAQAGLSWITILRKRENYRRAFSGFDASKVGRYNSRSITRLMNDAGIVRNRQKIDAAINNARIFLTLQQSHNSFSNYLWGFLDGSPIQNSRRSMSQVPATTQLSDTISKDMKQKGFRFFGSTICCAHMQAMSMVNDHLASCFRHQQCRDYKLPEL